MAGKYYVVWNGLVPGIYLSWEECKDQIDRFPDAKYKAFRTKEEAIKAFRGSGKEDLDMLRSISSHMDLNSSNITDGLFERFPDIIRNAIAVDGACSRNPGPYEYRGVSLSDGKEIFHVGPLQGGSNNIAEYLALVHALAHLEKCGNRETAIYTDSINALAWLRNRGHRSKITPNHTNAYTFELLTRADKWLQQHTFIPNRVLKWDTEQWGEIPADFGRKS